MADRPTAAERVTHLTERAERTRLTYEEGRILREAAKELTADLERARRVAVALENENARQEARVRTLTDGAADREAILTEARDALEAADAGGHGDDWPHLAPGIRSLHARAERAEQQLAQVRAGRDTWKAKAEEIERDRDRIATEHTEFTLKAGEALGRAQAETEWLRRTVLAECDAIEREVYGQHDEDDDGKREAVRRIRTVAALDGAQQPEEPFPAALRAAGVDPENVAVCAQQPGPAGEGSDQ